MKLNTVTTGTEYRMENIFRTTVLTGNVRIAIGVSG